MCRRNAHYTYRVTKCYDIAMLSTAEAADDAVAVITAHQRPPGPQASANATTGGFAPQEPTTLRCLMIPQPWAWATFHGRTVEARAHLRTTYRGTLAIHASPRWSNEGGSSAQIDAAWKKATTHCTPAEYGRTSRLWTARGEIIGLVELVDIHPETDDCGCQTWGQSARDIHDGRRRRRMTHLVLENPRARHEPIWCKGTSGLWVPPADIADRIEAQELRAETPARPA